MWCGNCHQDVPSVSQGTRLVCSQCQRPITKRPAIYEAPICDEGIELTEPVAVRKNVGPPVRPDDWSSRRRTRELDRALRRPLHFNTAATSATASALGTRRFDPPQNLFDAAPHSPVPTIATDTPPITSATQLRLPPSHAGQIISWLVVALGTLTLGAGVGIIGWSLHMNQTAHWNLALGLALGGQGALILGLVMVVSRLWRNSRFATNKLQELHARLAQLQSTADTISAQRSGGAPAFYADLARGASPQILLSNLKGQLDQLATRVG
jgi:hypothetical protein